MLTINKKQIIIYGFGKGGKAAYYDLKDKYEILAFVDGFNKEKSDYRKVPVISPKEILSLKYDYLYIASMYVEEIKSNLLDIGVSLENVKTFKIIIGLERALSPGDIAVQVGVNMYNNNSQILQMAQMVGKNGTVIGIEPDIKSINNLKKYFENNKLDCKVITVNKATYSEKSKKSMFIATDGNNQLYGSNGIPSLALSKKWTKKQRIIETDTIDNILIELGIPLNEISHINLTINGCEYETLKGMKKILETNDNMSITVIAGREKEIGGMGYIDGVADHEVISNYLYKYGYKVRFTRFSPGSYGHVIGVKGNKSWGWF